MPDSWVDTGVARGAQKLPFQRKTVRAVNVPDCAGQPRSFFENMLKYAESIGTETYIYGALEGAAGDAQAAVAGDAAAVFWNHIHRADAPLASGVVLGFDPAALKLLAGPEKTASTD